MLVSRPSTRMRLVVFLTAFLGLSAQATIPVAPTLAEVVRGSQSIGLVKLRKAEVYEVTDAEGVVDCGTIYEGDWVDSLTGDSGAVVFTSKQTLEVRALYLVYLGQERLPRKLLSTNSMSEAHRSTQLAREQACHRSNKLPRTLFSPSRFLNEEHVADEFKTGIWVEYPRFSKNEMREIVIMPSELSIDGEVLTRDRFLQEYYGEYKHQVMRTAAYSLVIFRAVDWREYCAKLVELAIENQAEEGSSELERSSFCERATNIGH